jgi:hypothetical protein
VSPQISAIPDSVEAADALEALAALQSQRVEEWVALVRFGDVIPLAVENSLSWKLTRPVRLAQTAMKVLRRDGFNRFWATVRARLRRLVGRS